MRVLEPEVDGRRLRRSQNREAVLDALIALFRDGSFTPSANEIAERAGISPRSLFRYFDDIEDLSRAAIERHLAIAEPLFVLDVDASAALPVRIARIVSARAELYETVGIGLRAGRFAAVRNPIVAAQLDSGRRTLRAQVRSLFAPELEGAPELLAMLDVALAFETWDLLRRDHRLGRTRAEEAVAAAVTALLGGRR
jgi:AcrR family transcriptional regulator